MTRTIIKIDQEACTGCGLCIPNCPEGAIQLIDGKARVVNDSLCDGLGACIGHCPEDAITFEERDADDYDEIAVIKNIIPQGVNVIQAHLTHLQNHGQTDLHEQAVAYLAEQGIQTAAPASTACSHHDHAGCPGSRSQEFPGESRQSALTHWPIQLHLLSPRAPQFHHKDLLLAADCTAFSIGAFHSRFLEGRALAIACPKLDSGQESYLEKLTSLVADAEVNTITVATMVVPCCSGLLGLAQEAVSRAGRKTPIKHVVIGVEGEVLQDEWV